MVGKLADPKTREDVMRCLHDSLTGTSVKCDVPNNLMSCLSSLCTQKLVEFFLNDPSVCCDPNDPDRVALTTLWEGGRCTIDICSRLAYPPKGFPPPGEEGKWFPRIDPYLYTILHEMGHCCKLSHGKYKVPPHLDAPRPWQCNDVLACCINKVVTGDPASCRRIKPVTSEKSANGARAQVFSAAR
jgi:hypothetical protein